MFLSKTELMQHRKLDHPQNVRPCKYYTQGNCARKKEKCWYSHDSVEDMETDQNDKLKANYVYNCKFCDKTFASKHMFMLHKKTDHIEAVPHCTKFNKGNCRLTSAQCWYTHKENEHAYKQEHIETNSVFQKDQEKGHPPDLIQRLFSMIEKVIIKVDNMEKGITQ